MCDQQMQASKRAAHEPEDEVHRRRREAWLEENREAIEAYNEFVRKYGVFSAGFRMAPSVLDRPETS